MLLSLALTVFFYAQLPDDVAYLFKSDGSAERWASRIVVVLWLLLPQLVLTLFAFAVVWGVSIVSARFKATDDSTKKLVGTLLLMGNMVALPQALLVFAMLDIFSYNSYQIHILPLWAAALIIVGAGSIILGMFFMRAIRDIRGNCR